MSGALARKATSWVELPARPQLEAVPLADAPEAPAGRARGAELYLVKFRRGLIAAAAGRDDRAVVAFREAIALKPSYSPALAHLGHALMRLNQIEDAAEAYRELVKLPLDDAVAANAYNNIGVSLYQTGRFSEAAGAYRAALNLKGDAPGPTLANLGHALLQAGQLQEAIAAYREAVQLVPGNSAAQFNLGFALYETGQFAEAVAAYSEAVRSRPDYASAYANLGSSLAQVGKLPEAIAAMRKAIELQPSLGGVYGHLAGLLIDAGQLTEAVTAAREATRLEPGQAVAHYNLGRALFLTGAGPDSLPAFRKAVDLRPDWGEALHSLGAALKETGHPEDALPLLRRSIELNPDNSAAHANLGDALFDIGQYSDAAAAYRMAITLGNPFTYILYDNIGVSLTRCGQSIEAVAAHREAIRLNPEHTPAYGRLGKALCQSGQYAASIEAFREARKRTTDSQERAELNLEINVLAENIAVSLDATKALIGSSREDNYNKDVATTLPDLETVLRAAAHHLGRPLETICAQLGIEDAASTTTERLRKRAPKGGDLALSQSQVSVEQMRAAPDVVVPPPPRLKWGKDSAPDENPAAFAWRAYAAEASAGTLHRGVIGREDKPLAVKLASWLRSHPMPEGIDIPTKPEWNTRRLAKLNGEAERDVLRLYAVARKRKGKIPTPAAS